MMRSKKRMAAAAVAVIAAAPILLQATGAFADTAAQTAFASKYQANVNTESTLMQQAQSAGTSGNSEAAALQASVQSLGQQIASLYGAEQALSSQEASIPKVLPLAESHLTVYIANLNKERSLAISEAGRAYGLMKLYGRRHEHGKYILAQRQHAAFEAHIGLLDRELASASEKIKGTAWNSRPFDGGMTSLQNSILALQASQIHYTREWIAVAKDQLPPAPAPSAGTVTVPSPAGMPVGTPSSITATFAVNGAVSQTLALPATALANGVVAFLAPAGLAAGTTYSVTVSIDMNGTTYSASSSYTAP